MNIFPQSPYIFYIDTVSGSCSIEFPSMLWHEPARAELKGHDESIRELREHFGEYPIGMWGYPIERLEFCSPMDIHANLTANENCYHDRIIRKFEVIGYVPDELPAEIHPYYHEVDDGAEEDEIIMEEAAAIRTPITIEENIRRGKDAMKRVISQHVNEPKAMYRKDVGWIAFYWGKPGLTPPEFKDQNEMLEWWKGLKNKFGLFSGGYGISHIVAKRDWEGRYIKPLVGQHGEDVAIKLVSILASGRVTKNGQRVKIIQGDYEANLETKYYEREQIWVLSGMKQVANEDYKLIFESSDGRRFSTMASSYTPQNFNSHFEVGADNSKLDYILNPGGIIVKPILESAAIDKEAHKAASSPKNDLPEPTQAQKEAGTYKMGHVSIRGLDISIENPAGSERSGIGADGKKWTSKMNHHYGYIKGTMGRDKDHLDVFLGPEPEKCDNIFIINQVDPKSSNFDEHKIMFGFESEKEAKDAYLSNYEDGWQGIGSISIMSMDAFKAWLKKGDTMKPASNTILESGSRDFFGQEIPPGGWIGFDFDGTLAEYDGVWKGYDHIGEPVPLMLDLVKRYIAEGVTVKIFTARATDPEGIPPIKAWLEKNGLGDLEVTNIKDQNMIKLYDDRAAKVIPNTGVVLEGGTQDWKSSILSAKSFDDIQSVFISLLPGAVKKAT